MNKMPECKDCKFLKMYDLVHKVYYCDHENRIDDMGKLSVEHFPETSPEWCPVRKEG